MRATNLHADLTDWLRILARHDLDNDRLFPVHLLQKHLPINEGFEFLDPVQYGGHPLK